MIDIGNGQSAVTRSDACIACRRRLCRFLDAETARKGPRDLLLQRGDRLEATEGPCLRFWTVVEGTAAICMSFADGRRQIIGLEHASDTVCGLMSEPETAIWLEALSQCHVCELDFSHQAAELLRNPEFIASVFGVTHRRLEAASRHVATLGRLDSTERVLLFLAEMARRNARGPNCTRPVALPMSREDIADYLGLNAETVSRIFSRIRKSGVIRFLSPTEYTVPDFAAIERRLPVPVPVPRVDLFERPGFESPGNAAEPAEERTG